MISCGKWQSNSKIANFHCIERRILVRGFCEGKQAFIQEHNTEVKLNKTFVLQSKINDFQLHLWILSKKTYHNIADGTTSSCVHNAI